MRDIKGRHAEPSLDRTKFVAHLQRNLASRLLRGSSRKAPSAQTPAPAQSRPVAADRPTEPAQDARRTVHFDETQRLGNQVQDFGRGTAANPQRIGDVLENRHMRPDRVGLENHTEAPPLRRDKHARSRIADHLVPRLIRPLVFCSRPATIRRVVVLPQPDGPSSVTNSPSATRRSTSFTATNSPNFRLTFSGRHLTSMSPNPVTGRQSIA